ncbi:hypothetical protein M569_08343, partial [Genlisea aurea]
MDLWQRARIFAEEAAKKSQELTQGIGAPNFSGVVSEASKRSKELAAEASKFSKELAADAIRRADQIKAQIPPAAAVLNKFVDSAPKSGDETADLEKFGVTDDLREFVKGITTDTFRDFPLEDDSDVSEIRTVANVRQDLSEWQEMHAKLVLSCVKEISVLRYELCPRVMKERKFWKIYFILVNSHLAPYERSYMEDSKLKKSGESGGVKEAPSTTSGDEKSKSKSTSSEQDLDVFLLGDHDDMDGG